MPDPTINDALSGGAGKPWMFLAGAAGSLAWVLGTREVNPVAIATQIAVGGTMTYYTTPAVARMIGLHRSDDVDMVGLVAFLIGLFGMVAVGLALGLVRRVHADPMGTWGGIKTVGNDLLDMWNKWRSGGRS